MFGDGVTSARIRVRPKAIQGAKAQQDWAWQPGGPWWSPSQQGFHAANARRRLSQWLPNKGTINTLVTQGGEILRDRSRDMVRNNPHAASAADSYVGNLIGTGIRPSSTIPDPKLRAEVNKLWAQWACECDVDGQVDFYGMQELVARSLFEAGECFIRFRPRSLEDGLSVPLQLLVLESDLLDYAYNLLAPNGNLIMNGIEFDASHRRIAYHFWPYHPGQIIITPLRDFRFRVRIPAEEILHIFKPKRPGDVRGVPLCSSALVKLFLLDQYDDAELDRKKVAAMFAGFVKSPQPEEMLIQDQSGPAYPWEPDEGLVTLEPGTIQTLLPGEDITFSAPAAVGGDYEPFQYRQILPAFQAMGVPYALGAGDLRHANYSSLRGAIVEYRRRLGQMQQNVIVHQMCRPIYERWFRDALLSESLDIPDFADDPRTYLGVKWIPPKFEWVDPLKDQQGEKLSVDSGFKSRSDVIEQMGDDPLDTDLRIKQDHLREQVLGLDFPAGSGKGKVGAPGQPGQPGEEGEEGGGKQFDGEDVKQMLEDQGIELDDDVAEKLSADLRDRLLKYRAFEESQHPRVPKGTTEGGQFTKAGETGEAGSKKKSEGPDLRLVGDGDQRQTVPFGLGLPEGSPLQKAIGAGAVSYGDAEKVTEQIAKATGANVLATHHVVGGWTDPSTGEYSSEPTLVGEFHGEPHDATFAAEAIAHVLGPQKEVWVVRDAEGLPAARDLRIDIIPTKHGVTPQQLAEVARKVDPELLAGFTQTIDAEGRAGITLLIPEGIAKRPRAETTSVRINPMGSIQPMEVLVNPREREIRELLKGSDYAEARVIRDEAGNLYVWDAYDAIHRPVAKALGVELTKENYFNDTDIWQLVKGKLVSQSPVGRDVAEQLPRRWIAETHAVPKGPATIADKADAAVMKLAGALADAGIDADVLPTAAIVDKRIGDAKDWRGYSASLEREAGAHAVAALDRYRAQLGESLAQGRGVPAFHEDLRQLARQAAGQQVEPPTKIAATWRARFLAKEWDESQHERGKTSPASTPGSFAPSGEGGLYDGPTQDAYHGSKQAGFEKFNVPDAREEFMIDRAIGVHVAKDPKVAEFFTKKDATSGWRERPSESTETKGGVYALRIPTDEHLLEVDQPLHPYITDPNTPKKPGNVATDQNQIAKLVYGIAFRQDPEMLARWMQRSMNIPEDQAREGADKLVHGRPWGGGIDKREYKSVDELLNDRGALMWDENDRARAVELFHDEMASQGKLGLKYINTSPMETEGVDDPTAYVIFNPRNIRHKYTGARARLPLDIVAKEFDEAKHPRVGKGSPTGGEFTRSGTIDVGGVSVHATPATVPAAKLTGGELEKAEHAAIDGGSELAASHGMKPLEGSKGGHVGQASTRRVTALMAREGRPPENPDKDYLQPNIEAMKIDPDNFADNMSLFKIGAIYTGMRASELKGKNPEQIAQTVKKRLKENLTFLYCHMPVEIRERSKLWYVGARRMVDDQAKKYKMSDLSVAAVYATLSPSTDWYHNVSLAERIIDIHSTKQAFKWDAEMTAVAKTIWKPDWPNVENVQGKQLNELSDPIDKAAWIRTYDQAHNPQTFDIMLPEGEHDGAKRNISGKRTLAKLRWQSLKNVSNAIQAIEANGDREKISPLLGDKHKVRSFFNNFLDPFSPNGDVTIDTHAVAAAWLQPWSNQSPGVMQGLASSTPKGFPSGPESTYSGIKGPYALYADAYREAAADLGLKPRELQSAVWEMQRGVFPGGTKVMEHMHDVWSAYHDGKVTLAKARNEALRYGYEPPDWWA
jgi:lambda family phage portal protein